MKEKISQLRAKFEQSVNTIDTHEKLEQLRVAMLGKKGSLTELFQDLKQPPFVKRTKEALL